MLSFCPFQGAPHSCFSAPYVIPCLSVASCSAALKNGGVKFSMKTLQHVGHASTKWTLNGVALKKGWRNEL